MENGIFNNLQLKPPSVSQYIIPTINILVDSVRSFVFISAHFIYIFVTFYTIVLW